MADELASTVEQPNPGQGGDPAAPVGAPDPTTVDPAASEAQIDYEKLDWSKVDVSKAPLERILEREDLTRHLQSLKDREAARIESKLRQEALQREAESRRATELAERATLLEQEDYDALGRKTAEQMREEQSLLDAAAKVSASVEQALREHPEYRVLGEDVIDQTYNDVRAKGGNIVDFQIALAGRKHDLSVKTLAEQLRKEQREEFEAILTERGLTKREDAVKTQETAVAAVSGATASTGQKPLTYEEASLAYGEGDISYEEFKPFKIQHDKDRKK